MWYIRSNHQPNEISKAIMARSSLRDRFLKNRNEENRKLFWKQRSKWVSLLWKSKKHFFENLNEKNVIDNERFWKTVKPFLSKKKIIFLKISPKKKTALEVAEELNNLFANSVKKLNIWNYENCDSLAESIDDPTLRTIAEWRNHPSILAIGWE